MRTTQKILAMAGILGTIALSSCQSKHNLLMGKWHGVTMVNPDMDSFFIATQKYIDTFGRNADAKTAIELYGTDNLDSLRHAMQVERDSAKTMQDDAIKRTVFEFRKDSLVLMAFGGGPERNSKWFIEGDTVLVLEQTMDNGLIDRQKGVIKTLNKEDMVLKFKDEKGYSLVTFKKEKS